MTVEKVILRPEAILHFTQEEVKVLMDCSAAHYDYTCKQLSKIGGLIYGMSNTIEWPCEIRLTFGDVDLLAKVTEMRPLSAMVQAATLNRQFSMILKRLNDAFEEANKEIK